MRRAAKRDGNETALTDALDGAGARWWKVSGPGLPDLLILGRDGRWHVAEVKNPEGRNRPTQRQEAENGPWPTIRTPGEALALLQPSKTGQEAG